MNLMGNKLNKLPADIGSLHMLIELNVSQNNLSSLPPSISQLTSLSKLDLSRNYYSNLGMFYTIEFIKSICTIIYSPS